MFKQYVNDIDFETFKDFERENITDERDLGLLAGEEQPKKVIPGGKS